MQYQTLTNNPKDRMRLHPWAYWDDAFTVNELKRIEEYCDNFELNPATIMGNNENVEKVRKSNVKFHNRNTDTDWIFDRLNFVISNINNMFYNMNLCGYDSFQYTVYDSDNLGFYDWHMDTGMGEDPENAGIRKLSMTILLNEDFDGGVFEINIGRQEEPIRIEPKMGRAILFPSYVIHRVAPVLSGKRKSLVVWCLGPKFI